MEERLQKLMAQAGIGSRRESEKMIEAGRVRVNGRVARLGDKADLAVDRIVVDGRVLNSAPQAPIYIALHKPKGVISSLEDELQQGRQTVRDLIDIPGHLYPVGRLDKQSTGLMLMTNDGDLAHKLTHPRFGHEKTYHVTLDGKIAPELLSQWRRGVKLDGRRTAPAKIRVLQQDASFTQLEIVMREGRKRQIRRIASLFGCSIKQLARQSIGPLNLGDLKPGQWRHLSTKEVRELQATVGNSLARPRRRQQPGQGQAKKNYQKKQRKRH